MRALWAGLAVAAAVAAFPALAAEWTTMRNAETGVTAQFPGAPVMKRGTSGPESGEKLQISYTLNGADSAYTVMSTKFDVTLVEAQLTQALDASVTAGIKTVEGTELARRTITIGGVQGREAEYSTVSGGASYLNRMRVFYRNGWLHSAIAMQSAAAPQDAARRMVSSLQPIS